jgi:hypothetical protein
VNNTVHDTKPQVREPQDRRAKDNGGGLRPEPALVRDRRAGLRAAGLDPDARPDRHRPPLGTQAAPAAAVLRGRPPGSQRPPPAAPPRRTLALGRRHYCRSRPPVGLPVRLTSRNNHHDQEGEHQGPWNPAHPARRPASQPPPRRENQPPASTSGHHITDAKDRG